jgi:DNA polymerase-3 subunit epsilon
VLDTETTGLEPEQGHRIIEIGCVELVDRRLTGNDYHQYLQPDRLIDDGALEVHGITNDFLQDKPRIQEIAVDFLDYIRGAELVIHNAPFDVGFLNHELKLLGESWGDISTYCGVVDTLAMARQKHPGQKNSLDALCKRYSIDNSARELHGALLDARILAEVYLAMTGGQTSLLLGDDVEHQDSPGEAQVMTMVSFQGKLPVISATEDDLKAHQAVLDELMKASGGKVVWLH